MSIAPTSALAALSNDLTSAVARIAPSVLYVDAHPRRDASGFAWDERHVITVDHAIDREDDIALVTDGERRIRATLVGRDHATDLALLRSDEPLTVAPRSSAELAVGNIVLAVGRDEDGAPGATFGVLSALDGPWRTWRGGEIERFIRPDLNVYSGFSGGPLVDASGAVVGLNTWGLSRRTALTLPLGTLERIVAQLASGGRIARGYLGVALQSVRLPEALRAAHALDARSAALVVDVAPGGPAERGGVTIGDVILALGDAPIGDVDDLQRALGRVPIDTTQTVRLIRGGASQTLDVVVTERPHDDE